MLFISFNPKTFTFAVETSNSSILKPRKAKELEPSLFWAEFNRKSSCYASKGVICFSDLSGKPCFFPNGDSKETQKTFYRLNMVKINISSNPLSKGVLALLESLPSKSFPNLSFFKTDTDIPPADKSDIVITTTFINLLLRHEIEYYLKGELPKNPKQQRLFSFHLGYIYHDSNTPANPDEWFDDELDD